MFENLFKSKQVSSPFSGKRVVGFDLGSTSIKVVELLEEDGVVTLTTYGEIQTGPYAKGVVGEKVQLGVKEEQEAVIDVLRESSVTAKEAVYAVPLSSSFVTVVNFTVSEGEDVSGRVRAEARKYIPIPIKEVTLDWAEIHRDGNSDELKKEVLLAAIQNDSLRKMSELMQHINIPDQPTEIECFSIIRGVLKDTDETTAILDLGGSSSKLYITRLGLLERIHRVPVGGAQITTVLAKEKESDFVTAEATKRSTHLSAEDTSLIFKVHSQQLGRVLQEFRKVITQYEQSHNTRVGKVVITGGVSVYSNVKSIVSEVLEREVSIGSPFSKVAYPAFMEDVVNEIGPSFAVALGAALRQFE